MIERLLKAHVKKVAPPGVTVTRAARCTAAGRGAPTSTARVFDAARRALAAAFGREPVIVGEGGSIPVVGDFERVLKAPVLLVGLRAARRERARARRVDLGGQRAPRHARDGDAARRVRGLIPLL